MARKPSRYLSYIRNTSDPSFTKPANSTSNFRSNEPDPPIPRIPEPPVRIPEPPVRIPEPPVRFEQTMDLPDLALTYLSIRLATLE